MADCRQSEPFCIPPESLAAHRQWLATNGGLGTRLTLQGDHPGANLAGADLRKADLKGVNLRGADLTGAKLRGADLTGANLHDASLVNADLTDAHGLCENQTGGAHLLGGANLSGATLPEDVAKFEGLANVEELSKNAGKVFVSMLSADALMQLIIAQTTDVQLMTDSGTTPIPVLDANIPITTLFWLGPLVLYGLYFAFHLYLQRLWETLASLPAIFPDGMLLPQKSYPWLLNDMVGLWSRHLKTRTPPLAKSQGVLFAFLAYSLVPVSLLPFWARYLIRHDWKVTAVHILLLTVFLWSQMMFFFLAKATLRRSPAVSDLGQAPWWRHDWWEHRGPIKVGRVLAPMVLCLVWGVCFLGVSAYAINWGVPRQLYARVEVPPEKQVDPNDPNKITNLDMVNSWYERHPDLGMFNLRRWIPRLLGEIGYSPFSSLEQAELSTKPDRWTDTDSDQTIWVRKWVRLKNTNLRYANLSNAFLVKADLSHANLEDADLRAADLRGADMEGTVLNGADLNQAIVDGESVPTLLEGANLQQAKLNEAGLQQADLIGADLRNAYLSKAALQSADLSAAILDGADLTDAELQGADLQHASLKRVNLRGADLTGAILQWADLTSTDLEKADLTKIEGNADSTNGIKLTLGGANLQGANLQGANLYLADLRGATLDKVNLEGAHMQGVDLTSAKLMDADLEGANLTSARGTSGLPQHAILCRAKLQGAQMQKIDITGADLTGAHLEKANLTGALLQGTILTGITYSSDTKWPSGFHPPKSGDTKETKSNTASRQRSAVLPKGVQAELAVP